MLARIDGAGEGQAIDFLTRRGECGQQYVLDAPGGPADVSANAVTRPARPSSPNPVTLSSQLVWRGSIMQGMSPGLAGRLWARARVAGRGARDGRRQRVSLGLPARNGLRGAAVRPAGQSRDARV